MARIRSIKPEFFTSEDICALPPFARLLYIALWCEADRKGRLVWKPGTFKLRYFPGDEGLNVKELCDLLVMRKLVTLYGDGLAFIPSFEDHQHINPRESDSTLPDPDASPRVRTRQPRDSDAQVGKEGKGKEGKEDASGRGTRLSPDWQPSETEKRWAEDARPDLTVTVEIEKFRDYWVAKAGADASKRDWTATWRNWIRNAHATNGGVKAAQTAGTPRQRRELGA